MNRRQFLKGGVALAGGAATTGCLSRLGFERQSAWRDPPLVQNRPDAVYYPAVVEGMGMYGMVEQGDLGFALMHSFPHRFWTLTGTNKSKVVVRSEDSLHLMASVWDTETMTVLPLDVSIEVSDVGGKVTTTNLWPMISPTMGFHYGDNVALPGEGTYDVTLSVGPLQTARTRAFEERLTTPQSASMEFTFDIDEAYDLMYRRVGEKAGSRDTAELMEMEMTPTAVAPPRADLPGRVVGDGTSGDATFLTTVTEPETRFGDRPQLIVSPRSPYNRVVLPRMSLAATVERDGKTVSEGPLLESLDPELGCYYGSAVPGVETGDIVAIDVEAPPQLARHDGYETAFIDMPPVEFTV